MTSELEAILKNLPAMSFEKLERTMGRLTSLGVELPEGPARRPGVTCPIMQLPVVTPCKLSKCPYYIENEWSRNCLLEYMEGQDSDTLAVEEIAYLYQVTPAKVEKSINFGMKKLREKSVETVGFGGDFKRKAAPKVSANTSEDDDFDITHSTLSPTFMGSTNKALDAIVSPGKVFKNPAIRLLGVLDSIIDELE